MEQSRSDAAFPALPCRIVLVDSATVRRILHDVLALQPGWAIVGEADSLVQARFVVQILRPDVVVVEPAVFSAFERESLDSAADLGEKVVVYSWFREGPRERLGYVEAGHATADKAEPIWSLVNQVARLSRLPG